MGGRDANFAPSVWAIISVLNFHKLCFKKFITTHMQTNSKTTVFILCRVCTRYVFTPLNLQKAFVKSVITFNIFLDPTSFCIHINLNIYIDIRVRVWVRVCIREMPLLWNANNWCACASVSCFIVRVCVFTINISTFLYFRLPESSLSRRKWGDRWRERCREFIRSNIHMLVYTIIYDVHYNAIFHLLCFILCVCECVFGPSL